MASISFRPQSRSDLIFFPQAVGDEEGFVVKDPVEQNYFWFNRFQSWLLQHFDGDRPLDEICQQFNQEFTPQQIDENQVAQFAAQSLADQLLLCPESGERATDRARRREDAGKSLDRQMQQLLAIRFPAINAGSVFRFAESLFGFLFSVPFFLIFTLLFLFAGVSLFENSERLVADLMTAIPTAEYAVTFLVAISITKICHEFGHAIACRRIGAECHHAGMMLLFFTPCLYCDVSDARTVDSRYKRMMVMAGGVYIECLIASIAVIAWLNCESLLLRYFLINIAIVASFSTVLVNLNPLMKFDGYYLFSEWMQVQNLSSKAQQLKQRWFRSSYVCLPPKPENLRTWYGWYGVAASGYRCLIYLGFFIIALTLARQLGVQAIVIAVAILFAILWTGNQLSRTSRQIRSDIKAFRLRPIGASLLILLVFAMLYILFFVKIPTYVWCDAVIQRQGRVVTAPADGILKSMKPWGSQVSDGDVIVQMQNEELTRLRLDQEAEIVLQQNQLQTQKLLASASTEFAASLPELNAKLQAALARNDELIQAIAELQVVAPFDGKILPFVPRDISADEADPMQAPVKIDPRMHLGMAIHKGTEICFVADSARDSRVILIVDQRRLDLIQSGQSIQLRLNSRPEEELRCEIPENYSAVQTVSGAETRFRIGVLSVSPLPPHQHLEPGKAKVLVARMTIFQMIRRALTETFSF